MSILVLGLGNSIMTDDGFGVRAVNTLSSRYHFQGEATLVDGGTLCLDLLPYLEGVESLLIIDALDMRKEPGRIFRLEGEEVPRAFASKLSVHQMGLQDLLRQRRNSLFGILNGVDYDEWSPEADRHIPHKFSARDRSGKRRNKDYLLKQLALKAGLAEDEAWHAYDAYRRFLGSYAQAAWGVDVERFDLVEEAKRRHKVAFKTDLPGEAMREIAEGKTNKEIAAELYIAEGTVKNHVSSILSRLGVRDRVTQDVAGLIA